MIQWILATAVCFFLSASFLSGTGQASEVEPDVAIEQAWIRAMPPTRPTRIPTATPDPTASISPVVVAGKGRCAAAIAGGNARPHAC